MIRKIILIPILIIPSYTFNGEQLVEEKINQSKPLQPENLKQKALLSDKLYNSLLNKRQLDLEKQAITDILAQRKRTFSDALETAVVGGLLTIPTLTINYLNKYITPEKYQPLVHNVSLAPTLLIGGLVGRAVVKKTVSSLYDSVMYERNQQATKNKFAELDTKMEELNKNITKIKQSFTEADYSISDTSAMYEDFLNLYKSNYIMNITKSQLDYFLTQHPAYTKQKLLSTLYSKKINLTFKLDDIINDPYVFPLQDFLTQSFNAFSYVLGTSRLQEFEQNKQSIIDKIKTQINTINAMIKNLESIGI